MSGVDTEFGWEQIRIQLIPSTRQVSLNENSEAIRGGAQYQSYGSGAAKHEGRVPNRLWPVMMTRNRRVHGPRLRIVYENTVQNLITLSLMLRQCSLLFTDLSILLIFTNLITFHAQSSFHPIVYAHLACLTEYQKLLKQLFLLYSICFFYSHRSMLKSVPKV